jgi:hypothetical protein
VIVDVIVIESVILDVHVNLAAPVDADDFCASGNMGDKTVRTHG